MDHTLYKSARRGDIKLIEEYTVLLDMIVTPNNNTILHVNIAFGCPPSTEFVERVLEVCPPLLIQVNDYRDTPLHVAARTGRVDIVEVLIKHARAQDRDLESNVTAIKQMLRMTNNDGNTALHEAAQNYSLVEMVKLLTIEDHDFPHDSVNNYGETALYIAVSRGSLEVVVEMLKSCTTATYKGPRGTTILHAAVRRNHLDITRKILKKNRLTRNADKNGWSLVKETDEYGWTPIHYAAYYGHYRIAMSLLKFDASAVCIADKCRMMTALHLAAGQGRLDIANIIKRFSPACIEQVDNRGWNYIHFYMCTSGYKITYGKEGYLLNAKDIRGNTPLLVLALFDTDEKIVRKEFIDSTTQIIRDREEQFNQLKIEVSELSNVRDEPYKLGVVRRRKYYIERLSSFQKEREKYLVVATLIATVTFTMGLTLPGGYIQDGSNKGTAVLIKNQAFQAFIISDVIALILSVSAVLLHVLWRLGSLKKHLIFMTRYAHICTIWALLMMIVAFVTGAYAILRPSLGLAITTAIVGSTFFLIHYRILFKITIESMYHEY